MSEADPEEIAKALAALVDVEGESELQMHGIEFEESGLDAWQFLLRVKGPAPKPDLLIPVKDMLESDRDLGGLAVDVRVPKVRGPYQAEGQFRIDWFIHVLL